MKDPRDIIVKPVVSEKSYGLFDVNVYTFVVHKSATSAPDTILETARMTAYPDEQTAHSDDPVTISQGQSIVVGSGMDYNG